MKTSFYLTFALLSSLTLIFSCSSDDSDSNAAPKQAITFTFEDLPIAPGFNFGVGIWNPESFGQFDEGENVTWDFSDISVVRTGTVLTYEEYSSDKFPTGNIFISTSIVEEITGQTRTYSDVRELTQSGYYELGRHYTNELLVPIFDGAGSLLFQNNVISSFEPKRLIFEFPIEYGDKSTSTHAFEDRFVANLPSAGIVDAVAATLDTWVNEFDVVGWGTIKLPGYAQGFDVLMVEDARSGDRQYLLNDAPAPPMLLAQLGLADRPLIPSKAINFLTKEHGIIARFLFSDGVLYSAFFRNDIPQ